MTCNNKFKMSPCPVPNVVKKINLVQRSLKTGTLRTTHLRNDLTLHCSTYIGKDINVTLTLCISNVVQMQK